MPKFFSPGSAFHNIAASQTADTATGYEEEEVSTTTVDLPAYPKIETLYERDPDSFKVTDTIRLPEFDLITSWLVTEKLDGTNVRVFWDGERATFGGRSNNAQMPTFLLAKLQDTFTSDVMLAAFPDADSVVLFGEGYGPKIQKAGGNYRADVNFRLFDVKVGDWWLNWEDVEDVATNLRINTVPVLDRSASLVEALQFVEVPSATAGLEGGLVSFVHEGIVARTNPLLFTRRGHRVMWKLKGRDYRGGKL